QCFRFCGSAVRCPRTMARTRRTIGTIGSHGACFRASSSEVAHERFCAFSGDRMRRWLLAAFALCAARVQAQAVSFEWFQYAGHDAVFATPLPAGSYRNPILAGFYSDPSITRAGDRFYLVSSTFTYFPGIPVLESADLVHWTKIGDVISR